MASSVAERETRYSCRALEVEDGAIAWGRVVSERKGEERKVDWRPAGPFG